MLMCVPLVFRSDFWGWGLRGGVRLPMRVPRHVLSCWTVAAGGMQQLVSLCSLFGLELSDQPSEPSGCSLLHVQLCFCFKATFLHIWLLLFIFSADFTSKLWKCLGFSLFKSARIRQKLQFEKALFCDIESEMGGIKVSMLHPILMDLLRDEKIHERFCFPLPLESGSNCTACSNITSHFCCIANVSWRSWGL